MTRPALHSIFTAFLAAGAVSFGGAMPHVQRLVVEKKEWMDAAEFAGTVGLCQFIPGPNATNASICVGQKLRGPMGALVAATGLLFFPILFAVLVASLFDAYAGHALVRNAAHGMAIAGTGLLLGAGVKLLQGIKQDRLVAYAIAGAILVAVALLNVPLLLVIGIVVITALLFSLYRTRKACHESV